VRLMYWSAECRCGHIQTEHNNNGECYGCSCKEFVLAPEEEAR